VTLHNGQKLDDDFGGWADEDLALARLLGIVDRFQGIIEDGSFDHFGSCGRGRFSMATCD